MAKINVQEVTQVLRGTKLNKLLKDVLSHTDTDAVFEKDNLCDRYIQLKLLVSVINSHLRILGNSIDEYKDEIEVNPFVSETVDGQLIVEGKPVSEQDVAALFEALPREVFLASAKVTKSLIPGEKDEKKQYTALVDLHTHKTGITKYFKVIPRNEEQKTNGKLNSVKVETI